MMAYFFLSRTSYFMKPMGPSKLITFLAPTAHVFHHVYVMKIWKTWKSSVNFVMEVGIQKIEILLISDIGNWFLAFFLSL